MSINKLLVAMSLALALAACSSSVDSVVCAHGKCPRTRG